MTQNYIRIDKISLSDCLLVFEKNKIKQPREKKIMISKEINNKQFFTTSNLMIRPREKRVKCN